MKQIQIRNYKNVTTALICAWVRGAGAPLPEDDSAARGGRESEYAKIVELNSCGCQWMKARFDSVEWCKRLERLGMRGAQYTRVAEAPSDPQTGNVKHKVK